MLGVTLGLRRNLSSFVMNSNCSFEGLDMLNDCCIAHAILLVLSDEIELERGNNTESSIIGRFALASTIEISLPEDAEEIAFL